MALITLNDLKVLWQNVSDWVKGTDAVSAPKVTINSSALPTGAATEAKQDIVNGAIKTVGSAVGTKAALIAGSDGTNAQTIKTNTSGEQLVVVTGSKVEYLIINKTNPLYTSTTDVYEMRTSAARKIQLPHVIDKNNNPIGVFEQTILIEHTYDKQIVIKVYPAFYKTAGVAWATEALETITLPAGNVSAVRLFLTPEKKSTLTDTPTRFVRDYPELRSGVPLFELEITPQGAPTTGELIMYLTRRY